jgi:predicted enzyme related to lactoylglutathione lyase
MRAPARLPSKLCFDGSPFEAMIDHDHRNRVSNPARENANAQTRQTPMGNPVYYFEIPVTDLDRAILFYEAVFGYKLDRRTVDGYAMAFFPRADDQPGASGALAKGDIYVPSKSGPVIYFDVADVDALLKRAQENGAKILYPKKYIGEAGYVAEIEDSEGNRIALSEVTD